MMRSWGDEELLTEMRAALRHYLADAQTTIRDTDTARATAEQRAEQAATAAAAATADRDTARTALAERSTC